MSNIKAGFIGCGNMGGVLAAVAAKALGLGAANSAAKAGGASDAQNTAGGATKAQNTTGGAVYVADHNQYKVDQLAETFGCKVSSAEEIARECDLIFLGVKPQVMGNACEEIKDVLAERSKTAGGTGADSGTGFCIVSMAAGLKIEYFEKQLGKVPVIRMMPNTPCATGAGVVLYSVSERVAPEAEQAFMELMRPAGMIIRMEEAKIDKGSVVSGCGPAFVYMFIDALIDAGVRVGLPRVQAKQLAIQTVLGSAMMCTQSGAAEPAKLKADVCSPAGSTIEGVMALEDYAFRAAIMEAVKASYDRTVELGK